MAWREPRTDWQPGDGIKALDFNRIESNIGILSNDISWSGKDTPLIMTRRNGDDYYDQSIYVSGYDNTLLSAIISIPPLSKLILRHSVFKFARTYNASGSNYPQIRLMNNNNILDTYNLSENSIYKKSDFILSVNDSNGNMNFDIGLTFINRPPIFSYGSDQPVSLKIVDLWALRMTIESIDV